MSLTMMPSCEDSIADDGQDDTEITDEPSGGDETGGNDETGDGEENPGEEPGGNT